MAGVSANPPCSAIGCPEADTDGFFGSSFAPEEGDWIAGGSVRRKKRAQWVFR